MKKSYLILIFCIIITLLLVYNYLNTNSKIDVYINNSKISIKDETDIKLILKSINSAKKIKHLSGNYKTFYINIIKNKKTKENLCFHVDYNKKNIYFLRKGIIYKINEEYENFYFTHKAFESLYKYKIPPSIKIISDGKELKCDSETKWYFRKLDNKYYSFNYSEEFNEMYIFNEIKYFTIGFSYKPIKINYELYKDSVLINKDIIKDNTFKIPNINGKYKLKIISVFNDKFNGYKGVLESIISFEVKLPVTFTIDKKKVYQGDIIKVTVNNLNSNDIPFLKQNIFKSFSFSEIKDNSTYGYIPITYKVKNDNYIIDYGINNEKLGDFIVEVLPREFKVQHLIISEDLNNGTRNDKAYNEFNKFFKPRRFESNSEPYFDKPFILPVKGRLTTEYGQTRFINGSPTSYNHSGIDIAAPLGTKIVATNNGKVTLSKHLTLTGNTVLIDHGDGFFSIYYHMNEMFVKENDFVTKGQEIGTVGSTGFSTGPHLHFNISYYDQNLEPGYFIYNKPIKFENYKSLFNNK